MSAQCQVLVVGAGPVGLFAGLCAKQRGLSVKVVDEFWRSHQRGHAALLHERSVALLSDYGLGAQLAQHGLALNLLSLRVDDRLLASMPLRSSILAIPQALLERALLQELRRSDVELLMTHKAIAFSSCESRVTVTIGRREAVLLGSPAAYAEWPEVERSKISAGFVVGADGRQSTVRQALDSRFQVLRPSERYLQFEFECVQPNLKNEIAVSIQGDLASVVFPLPDRRMRAAFQVSSGSSDHAQDLVRLEELLRERMPWFQGKMGTIDFSAVIEFEPRFVERFGSKRIWLVGDAAHMAGPIGAQSLNVGLLEARDVVDALAAVEHRGASLSKMDSRVNELFSATWRELLGVERDPLVPHPTPGWMADRMRQIISVLPASGACLQELLARLAALSAPPAAKKPGGHDSNR